MPPARSVSRCTRCGPSRELDLVVGHRPPAAGGLQAVADLDGLHRLHAHQRAGQAGVEPAVPVHVAAQARRQAVDDDLDDPTEGVAVLPDVVDLRDHARARRRVGAADGVLVDPRVVVRPGQDAVRHQDRADRDDVADHLGADGLPQERRRDGAEGDPGGGLAGAGPLEHRPGVVEAVLLHARQVGVAGPRAGERGVPRLPGEDLGVDRVGGHDRRPLGPLGVADLDRDRSALGAAVPDPAGERDLVLLEGHPGAPAVPEPAAGQGGVQVGGLHLDAGREPLEDGGELLTVRLTCGQPAQHARDSARRARRPRPVPLNRGARALQRQRQHGAGEQRRPERQRRAPSGPPGGQEHHRDDGADDQAEEDPGQQDAPARPAEHQPEQPDQLDVAEAEALRGHRRGGGRRRRRPPRRPPAPGPTAPTRRARRRRR